MNKSSKLISAALLSSTALSPFAISVASAETEEIVVTATRRATSVQDIPYNISAVSGDTIERSNMLDTAELLRSIPGVTVMERGVRNQGTVNTIMIRGVNVESGALGDYAVNTVPTVSSYIDDTPIFANMMIKDLERVEVLRGPQGTLYGSGSLGGTLRYITRDPVLGEFSGNLGATFRKTRHSDDFGNAQDVTLNLPLGEKAALRIVANRTDLPGSIDYVNVYELDGNGIPVAPSGILSDDATFRSVEDADTIEQWFGRASLRFEPSENVDITLTHARQSDEAGGRRAPSLGANGDGTLYGVDEQGSIQLEPSSRDVNMTSLEINVDLGFATLTSSTSMYNHDGESVSENTGFYVNIGWMSAFYYNYPRPMASAYRTYEDEAVIQEIRLASNNEGPLNFVVGAYYQDQDRSSTQMSFLPGFNAYVDELWGWDVGWVSGDQDWNYASEETYEEIAIFGELSYDVSDAVTITGGFRWFDNEMTISTFNHLPLWTGFYSPNTAVDTISDDDVLFKGNISWDVSEDTMVYATVSEGYRHGGTTMRLVSKARMRCSATPPAYS
jgi:outer membrane receptor protein involved in Fe transport